MRSGIVVALPLTAVSSQFVIGSFEARFFCARLTKRTHECYAISRDPNGSPVDDGCTTAGDPLGSRL